MTTKDTNDMITGLVDIYKNLHELVKMHAASQDKEIAQQMKDEEMDIITKTKHDNKVAKSYNLMRALTGSGPMLNEDLQSGTEGLRYYSGSKTVDKAAADKVRKSYELMKLFGASQ